MVAVFDKGRKQYGSVLIISLKLNYP